MENYVIEIRADGKGMIVMESIPEDLVCTVSYDDIGIYADRNTADMKELPVLVVMDGKTGHLIKKRAYIAGRDGRCLTKKRAREIADIIQCGTVQTPEGACTGCCAIVFG